jgi:ribosome maturation factor RimP
MDIVSKVENLIKGDIEQAGYILDEVLYEKEGSVYFLRVIIDKQGIVTIDDCVEVSNIVNPLLDEADLIKDNYILDVCSKEKGCE